MYIYYRNRFHPEFRLWTKDWDKEAERQKQEEESQAEKQESYENENSLISVDDDFSQIIGSEMLEQLARASLEILSGKMSGTEDSTSNLVSQGGFSLSGQGTLTANTSGFSLDTSGSIGQLAGQAVDPSLSASGVSGVTDPSMPSTSGIDQSLSSTDALVSSLASTGATVPGLTDTGAIPGLTDPTSVPILPDPHSVPGLAAPSSVPNLTDPSSVTGLTDTSSVPGLANPSSVPGLANPSSVPEITDPCSVPSLPDPVSSLTAADPVANLTVPDSASTLTTGPSLNTDNPVASLVPPVADLQGGLVSENTNLMKPAEISVSEPMVTSPTVTVTGSVCEPPPLQDTFNPPVTGSVPLVPDPTQLLAKEDGSDLTPSTSAPLLDSVPAPVLGDVTSALPTPIDALISTPGPQTPSTAGSFLPDTATPQVPPEAVGHPLTSDSSMSAPPMQVDENSANFSLNSEKPVEMQLDTSATESCPEGEDTVVLPMDSSAGDDPVSDIIGSQDIAQALINPSMLDDVDPTKLLDVSYA